MKLLCVNDQVTKGLFNKRVEHLDGLTKNKTYNALLLSDAEGQFTTTTAQFLVFNDNHQWETYHVNRFIPAEEQE